VSAAQGLNFAQPAQDLRTAESIASAVKLYEEAPNETAKKRTKTEHGFGGESVLTTFGHRMLQLLSPIDGLHQIVPMQPLF